MTWARGNTGSCYVMKKCESECWDKYLVKGNVIMANAILMASGLGSRMRPLTDAKPKPLIEVCGTPMIETVIAALNKYGVDKIFIVVGYLGDQFNYLIGKYSNVIIIRNTDYETINNISSIYYAREELKKSDVFICEADLYISDEDILSKVDTNKSGYCGIMVEGHSDDWVFEQNEEGFINRVGKVGDDCYNMCGLSFFRKEQANMIADEIERVYGQTGVYENMFWDDAVNNIVDKLNLVVFPVDADQIVEIDTVAELEEVNAKMASK